MKPARFFKFFFLSLPVLAITYGVAINLWFTYTDTFPTTYKYWVLNSIESPKVVITSGSNANSGVDPEIMEAYFKAPVVVVADVGAYPIYARLEVADLHLNPGDTLILPLEFGLYTLDDAGGYPTYGFKVADGVASEYFRYTDLIDRVRLTYLYMPPSWVLNTIFRERQVFLGEEYRADRLKDYMAKTLLEPGETRGAEFKEESRGVMFMSDKYTCDLYAFGEGPYRYSRSFEKSIPIIKRIRDRGIKVIVTYPVLVSLPGNECLTSPIATEALAFMEEVIRPDLAAIGVPLIGQQADFKYPPEYFNDSYFHVLKPAAKMRTKRLMEVLAQAGVQPYDNPAYDFDQTTQLIRQRILEAKPQ